ncbi:hypothetical protein D3C79_1090690 [compost metagenome]
MEIKKIINPYRTDPIQYKVITPVLAISIHTLSTLNKGINLAIISGILSLIKNKNNISIVKETANKPFLNIR